MLQSLSIVAQPGQGQGGAQANPLLAMLPFLLMFVVFYFLLIKPQKKRQKEHQTMVEALKKGDKVVTTGGILGTVFGVKDKTLILKVGEGETKIEFLKSAVSLVNDKDIGNS
jgi:preprotein translocase subunit YajC